jgi:hypothetical protein
MINGRDLLRKLRETSGATSDYFAYHSVRIPKTALERGIVLYQTGIDKFLGNCLLKRLEGRDFATLEALRSVLTPETNLGPGKWIDLAGMFAPESVIERMLGDIENGEINTLDALDGHFASVHESYPRYEWAWAADIIQQQLGKDIDAITAEDVLDLTTRWKEAVLELDHQLYADAQKEYAATAQIGFGLDGDKGTKQSDFEAVRGSFEADGFVAEIEKHIAAKSELAKDLIRRIERLRRQSPSAEAPVTIASE